HEPLLAIDALGAVTEARVDVELRVALARRNCELVCRRTVEVRTQVHAVVCKAGLLTNDRDRELPLDVALAKLFDEAVTDQAVSDDHDPRLLYCFFDAHGFVSRTFQARLSPIHQERR